MMTIKKIGSREKNDIVHKMSRRNRRIVNRAFERDALIVLGDIKHLRKRKQNKLHRKLTEGRVSVLQTDPVH
jgi:IS605 OrfB family transposase